MHSLRRIIALLLALALAAPVPASWGAQGAGCEHASAQLENTGCCDTSSAGPDCGSLCAAGHSAAIVLMPVQTRALAKDVADTRFEPAVAAALLLPPDTDPPDSRSPEPPVA